MASPKELELKLELPPASVADVATLPMLRALADEAKQERIVSVYFDTDKQKLRRKGFMLRVRRIGDRYVQTIKACRGSELFERDEWESEIADERPDLQLVRGTALEPYLDDKLCRQLKPIFETRVQRKSCRVGDGAGTIEVALDKGRIDTGKSSQPLCEVELELKLGSREALFEFASRIVEALPARLATKSKADRGYELIDKAELDPAKAEAVDLRRDMSVADGVRAIGRSCLKHIANNVPALQANDPEGVHEMRVGLRRLRTAISLFGDILTDPQTAAIKREARWLTAELAPARELDVLVTRVVLPARQRGSRLPGVSTISQELLQRRARALERAKGAVRSPRFRRLLLDVAAWLETGQWAKPRDDLLLERIESPIAAFAATELARRWRKIRKTGKALRKLDPQARHKLRIRGKRLRYAAEFFAPLFPGRKAAARREKFMAKLKELQNALGDLNDIMVHESLIRANAGLEGRAAPRQVAYKRAYAAGLLTGYEDARFEPVLADAGKAACALLEVKPFW